MHRFGRCAASPVIALAIGAMLLPGVVRAQSPKPIAPHAGGWQTWVLSSGDQFRLPAPPDTAATRAEIETLRSMAAQRNGEASERIAWWAAAAPSYRWNQVAIDETLKAGVAANMAGRRLALLHTALADAMVATWDSKYAHHRQRPAEVDPTLPTALTTPASPSYPDEYAVAGAVATAVLGAIYPQRAGEFTRLAEEAERTRLLAGVAFPSDIAAGRELGKKVAAVALERGRTDGSDQPWTGSVPAGPGLWNGANPVLPQGATWRPWLLKAPSEFRPAPPAAYDSPERVAEMAELRAFRRTPKTDSDALFWEYAVGAARNFQYWNAHVGRLLLEYGQAQDAPRVARAYALFQVGFIDAGIACWDAKYAYWTIRPGQLDREFKTLFPTPNHPSYPAAHACYSMMSATMLGHLFPRDAAAIEALARESGASRVWAGIHYPSDVAAGQQLGRQVAGRVIERARADGAELAAP